MRKNTSGFTLIEILVVCIILALLAGIGSVIYTTIRNDAAAKQGEGIATTVRSALERYYLKNNEYIAPVDLLSVSSSDPFNMNDADYTAAAKAIGTTANALKTSQFKFIPCTPLQCASLPNDATTSDKVYYIARANNDTSPREITNGSCKIILSGSTAEEQGPTSYVILYKSASVNYFGADKGFIYYRSANGTISISPTTNPSCKFS